EVGMTIKQRIEIYKTSPEGGGWTVRIGDRYDEGMCYGEMLETLVRLTQFNRVEEASKAPYNGGLKTAEEHAAWAARLQDMADRNQGSEAIHGDG
ncbi:MAG: hypothetical protein KGL35_20615, partial [Bradyrhizobium sp.]|nr:hypothetical protein [Bradyrhizobium sp.]